MTTQLTEVQKKLVEDNLEMAERAANFLHKDYKVWHKRWDECHSDCMFWLVKCASRWDPTKGVKFLTYYLENILWWRADVRRGVFDKWIKHGVRQMPEYEDDESSGQFSFAQLNMMDYRETDPLIELIIEDLYSRLKPKLAEALRMKRSGYTNKEIGLHFKVGKARGDQLVQAGRNRIREVLACGS